ncbi:MAG: sulfatase-like hydrolase/transferase [Gemmatimonadetes bacterium]|nr:sulfatase-like hydrolase/transferase [Gemmatimonadota bacterium]
MSSPDIPSAGPGRQELGRALGLVLLAWLVLVLQQAALFGRPSPYAQPYAAVWTTYFFYGLAYRALALLGLLLPFAAWWLWQFHADVPARHARWGHGLLGLLLLLVLTFDQADNEVMRFMGIHLTVNFLRTYGSAGLGQEEVLASLLTDRGGPFSGVFILLASLGLFAWAGLAWLRRARALAWSWRRRVALAAIALPFAAALVVYNLPGGRFRRERVQGAVLSQLTDVVKGRVAGVRPADLPALAAEAERLWLAGETAGGWRFAGDTTYPLLRVPDQPATPPAEGRWNVIYLQLETFRGWNVGHLRPDDPRPSATPFLDSLATARQNAYWSRALSFGPPTISGFMAGHCSLPPHSQFHVTTTFTGTALDCIPAVLRRHGWHTLLFSASDPDWDNETPWLRRWYDEHYYYPDAGEADRVVFRRAAERIRAAAATGTPFLATVISISNHYPFRTREPALDLSADPDPPTAIRNTMHYTDAVVREFVDSLRGEPWFQHTVIIVVGDHGYNFGEHDGERSQRNGFRESLWIPLVIAGGHPALVPGRHDEVASLLDVAPTIAELAGIREPTSWLGHNLATPTPPQAFIGATRSNMSFAEQGSYAVVGTPSSHTLHLFDALADPLQRHDLGPTHADTARALYRAAERSTRLTDYLVAANRITPAIDTATHLARAARP